MASVHLCVNVSSALCVDLVITTVNVLYRVNCTNREFVLVNDT